MTRAYWRTVCIDARALALGGQTIEAIKLIRRNTDCGLLEARDVVGLLMNLGARNGRWFVPEQHRGLLMKLLNRVDRKF